jgi:phosphoribosylformimino-5-aminoimidazole carboxamide ribotide isomerase
VIVYPAIDLIGGRVVRLEKGDFGRPTYYAIDPLELAGRYAEAGATWLHVVDLDGARSGSSGNLAAIQRIARSTGLLVQAGGGVRGPAQFERLLDAGVARVVIGSLAIHDPSAVRQLAAEHGSQRITLALDARADAGGVFRLATGAWQALEAAPLIDTLAAFAADGFAHFLITDIDRDGMLAGPNLELYAQLREQVPAAAIQASGGVQGLSDLQALRQIGVAGVVIGKALLEGRLRIEEALAP